MRKDVGREQRAVRPRARCCPALAATGELKTKPTQHSVKELRGIGIQPDVIVLRSDHPVAPTRSARRSPCSATSPSEAVIPAQTADTIYEVPLMLEDAGLGELVVRELGPGRRRDVAGPERVARRWSSGSRRPSRSARDRVVGKYVELPDAYLSASPSRCATPAGRTTSTSRSAGSTRRR